MADGGHIGQLRPDPRNARRHNPRNVGLIVDALGEVGAARSIVIDEDDTILAGNATIEAAAQAGIERLHIVEADGETIVAVRRRGLTPEQKRRLALFDNRAAELAEWDASVIAGLVEDTDLSGLFSDDELASLLAALDEPTAGLTDPDAVPEPPAVPITTPGDLWIMGRHRLLCGDSTVATDVERLLNGETPRLMVTDPPYGVAYEPSWRADAAAQGLIGFGASRIGAVDNDDRADWSDAYSLFAGDVAYVWHAGIHAAEVAAGIISCGFDLRAQIVWIKPSFAISRGHYNWQHEPCWYAVRKGSTASWIGDHSQSTRWDIASVGMSGKFGVGNEETEHGTQKPVECMARPLRNHDGDVYDPFLGSGTTMIAAEQLGRVCYGMEISPQYVDVCVQRWQDFTGQTATRETA